MLAGFQPWSTKTQCEEYDLKYKCKNRAVGNAIYLQFFNNIIPQIKMQCYRNIHQILI